jgi:hypothetical protein
VVSPKSRGRPAGRGRPRRKRQGPVRQLRLSDHVLRDALSVVEAPDVLDAEVWASGWLGQAWLGAELGERRPEHMVCMEVVGRACSRPSPHALAAVAAFRRVASPDEWSLLDGAVENLVEGHPAPSWLSAPEFVPVRAHRAADVWDSERVLFVEYGSSDPHARRHTLMAQVTEPGGTMVAKLAPLCVKALAAERSPCRGSWCGRRRPRGGVSGWAAARFPDTVFGVAITPLTCSPCVR